MIIEGRVSRIVVTLRDGNGAEFAGTDRLAPELPGGPTRDEDLAALGEPADGDGGAVFLTGWFDRLKPGAVLALWIESPLYRSVLLEWIRMRSIRSVAVADEDGILVLVDQLAADLMVPGWDYDTLTH